MFVFTGCSSQNTNKNTNANSSSASNSDQNQGSQFYDNFETLNIFDLAIGQTIMAVGQDDGSGVTAERIIIGSDDFDFSEFAMGPQKMNNNGEAPKKNSGEVPADFNPEDMPEGFTPGEGGGENRPDFSNMSEEELAQMRENMQARVGNNGSRAGGSGFAERSAAVTRLVGEILSVDGTIITIKIEDGGSKLVFLSGSTVIMQASSADAEISE